MVKKYKTENNDAAMVSEPAAVAYQAEPAMASLSIRVPAKDVMLAQEVVQRMGWVVEEHLSIPPDWRTMAISPEVEALTFAKRVDLGTIDYKELLTEALEEKYMK